MKKTLITKLHQDISLCNDAQIAAMKAFMTASFAPAGLTPSFEIVEENEEHTAERLLRLVRSEFAEADAGRESNADVFGRVELNAEQSAIVERFLANKEGDEESR